MTRAIKKGSARKASARKASAGRVPAKKVAAKKGKKAAAPAKARKSRAKRPYLRTLSDIRRFFIRNTTPYYFISATNFNLLNMDEWVKNFRFVNYIDCFDGQHPNAFVPGEIPHEQFSSIEDINNYLLSHPEVRDYVASRGPGGKACFLMFDERTEELCREIGLEVCFPSAKLRSWVDDKINTTRLAQKAGVATVPNWLGRVDSYEDLCRKTQKRLGKDLVIQTAYGDSGHTTFFISNRREWNRHKDEIVREEQVKVMKRIRCSGFAVEACVTRHGTIVGPLMTELVGFDELTPYKGGWCGNEVFSNPETTRVRKAARKSTQLFGEQLRALGYRGYFECDYLLDLDTHKIYLGEVNPRVTGASSMTNLSSFAHADAPLFLFHLLEWADVDYDLDVDAINDRWAAPENIEACGQLVMKHTYDTVDYITEAPPSGVWKMLEDGTVRFDRVQYHRRTVESEKEAFFLRIAAPGDYRYEGADLGILITPGRLKDDNGRLTKRAKAWINGIQSHYKARPLDHRRPAPAPRVEVGEFKLL